MAAGYISKALSTLAAVTARWVEFSDGSQAPVHGAIILGADGLPVAAATQETLLEIAEALNGDVPLSVALTDVPGDAGDQALNVGGLTSIVDVSFTRPLDTTAYASGDLVANATTPAAVVPLAFTVGRDPVGYGASGMVRKVRLSMSSVTTLNGSFRLHLYRALPTPTNGDNGTWLTDGANTYMGAIDITLDRVFTDGASGSGVPNVGSEINFATQIIYGLIEARGAYVPVSGQVVRIALEVMGN